MKGLTLTWSGIAGFFRQAAAVAGLVVAVGNSANLPNSVRSTLVLVSGALLTAEHYAVAQSSGSTTITIPASSTTNKITS